MSLEFEITCLGYLISALEMMENTLSSETKQIIENCMRNSLRELSCTEAINKYYNKYN